MLTSDIYLLMYKKFFRLHNFSLTFVMESKELEVIHVSSYQLFSENIFMI